jgi:hypothetical protein
LAVRPVVADRPRLPIAALVLPQPRRDRRRVAVRPVPAGIAMMRLLAAPRLVGWRWARALRSQFRDIGTLVDRVPVVQIEVPWGPEFDADLAHSIAEALCSIDSPAPVGERGTAVGRSA